MAPVVSGFQVSPREAQGRIPARAQVPGPCSEAGLPSNGVTSAEPITVQAWRSYVDNSLAILAPFSTARRMNAYGQQPSPDLTPES